MKSCNKMIKAVCVEHINLSRQLFNIFTNIFVMHMYIVFQSRNWSTFCHIRGLWDLKNSKVIKVAFTSPISLDEDKKLMSGSKHISKCTICQA